VAARRLPSWTVAPLSVLLLAAYTIMSLTVAADRAALADPLRKILTDSLANGIPRLLTAMIPVESTPDTVVVPVVAAWLAGLAGTEVAVRGGRVLLGCLPAAALFGGALYVVGPNAGTAGWPTLAFAGLVVLALAVSTRSGPDAPLADVPAKTRAAVRGRALAGAAAGLVVVAGLVAVVGPWVGARVSVTPVDPRRYVEPPQVDSLDESPLNRISGWALTPKQKLLEVGPTRAKGTTRLRLAVLPDYDGVTWRVGATYRNAGRVLPRPPALADTPTVEIKQDITVDDLTGRLLPVVPTPSSVEGARVAYDAATGTLIRPEGLTPGLHYTVTSEHQEPDPNLLPAADTPSGDAVARYLTVGAGVPEEIQRLADQLANGNGAAYDRAIAIEDFLAEHYRKVSDAPSGHAYPNLQFFLFGPRGQGGQVGTSEQFAASFALLARLTGLPSRVVVGFDVPARGGTVTGGDALAWPEVLFDDLGWVAFDPLPKSKDPRPVEEDFTPKPPTPPPSTSEAPPPSDSASASAPAAVLAAAPAAGLPTVVVAGGASGSALLVLVALAGSVVVLRRGLRRRRLAVGGPDERITGAWLEFTDALRLAGRPVPAHLAATEAAGYAAEEPAPAERKRLLRRAVPRQRAGSGLPDPDAGARPDVLGPDLVVLDAGESEAAWSNAAGPGTGAVAVARAPGTISVRPLPPLDALVAGVNTVGFAPGHADDEQADRAGAQAVAYADALRAHRSWWRRIWWSVRPGPLRWHR
jgi:transglutaminase-like putative cysteine protease